MLPFAATFVVPEASGRDAMIYGLIVGIATLYGVVVARRFGMPEVVEGRPLRASVAAVVAVVFGAVLGASAAIGVALGWTEPYWVPEPVLILVLYILMGKRDRIRGKAIGTALGVAAAIPVAIVAPSGWVLTAVGAVAFVVALTQAKTYWLMYGLYTFSLVLLLAAPARSASRPRNAASRSSSASASSSIGLPSCTRSETAHEARPTTRERTGSLNLGLRRRGARSVRTVIDSVA